jgi:hypothetical protein
MMDPTAGMHQILCKSWKQCKGDPHNDKTCVRGRKYGPYMESSNSQRTKKARQVKSKVKSMLIIFLDIKGTPHKEFIPAGQAVNFAYYCDVLW